MGAEHLVVIPSFWRDDKTAEVIEPRELTAEQWAHLTTRHGAAGPARCGRRTAWTSSSTRTPTPTSTPRSTSSASSTPPTPDLVNLCLDTGHYAYCGGDSVKLIETYGERIGYLHLKQVDPEILADVVPDEVPFGPAVQRGVMCEPPGGVPALEPVLAAAQGWASTCSPSSSRTCIRASRTSRCRSHERTREFLRSCGA